MASQLTCREVIVSVAQTRSCSSFLRPRSGLGVPGQRRSSSREATIVRRQLSRIWSISRLSSTRHCPGSARLSVEILAIHCCSTQGAVGRCWSCSRQLAALGGATPYPGPVPPGEGELPVLPASIPSLAGGVDAPSAAPARHEDGSDSRWRNRSDHGLQSQS